MELNRKTQKLSFLNLQTALKNPKAVIYRHLTFLQDRSLTLKPSAWSTPRGRLQTHWGRWTTRKIPTSANPAPAYTSSSPVTTGNTKHSHSYIHILYLYILLIFIAFFPANHKPVRIEIIFEMYASLKCIKIEKLVLFLGLFFCLFFFIIPPQVFLVFHTQ